MFQPWVIVADIPEQHDLHLWQSFPTAFRFHGILHTLVSRCRRPWASPKSSCIREVSMFLTFLFARIQHHSCIIFFFFVLLFFLYTSSPKPSTRTQQSPVTKLPIQPVHVCKQHYSSNGVILALNLRIGPPRTPKTVFIASSPILQAPSSMCCTAPLKVLNSRSRGTAWWPMLLLGTLLVGQWKIFWEWTAEFLCWRRSWLVVKVRRQSVHGQEFEVAL